MVKVGRMPAFHETLLPGSSKCGDVIRTLADDARFGFLFQGVAQVMCEVRVGVHRGDTFEVLMDSDDTVQGLFPGEPLHILVKLPADAGEKSSAVHHDAETCSAHYSSEESLHGSSVNLLNSFCLFPALVAPGMHRAVSGAGAAASGGASSVAASGLGDLSAIARALPYTGITSGAADRRAPDSTDEFISGLQAQAPTEPPPLGMLASELRRPLPELHVHSGDFADFDKLSKLLELPLMRVRLADADGAYQRKLSRHLAYALFVVNYREGHTRSEMDITVDVAALVARLLELLFDGDERGLSFTSAHNLADASGATLPEKRPDFMCWAKHALVFKGEYKMLSTQWDEATEDLLRKMTAANVLALSGLPYLLCYAVAGTQLQFFALHEHRSDRLPTLQLQPISEVLNARALRDCATAVVATCNVFRVLCALQRCVRPSYSTVRFNLWHERGQRSLLLDFPRQRVVKKCVPTAPIEVARELYGHLKAGLPGCIRLVKWEREDDGRMQLELTPLAMQTRPLTAAEYKAAFRCILTALAAVHARGFVHRDVRAPNILYAGGHGGSSEWLLIDFEAADKNGSCLPTDVIAREYLPPEVQAGNPARPYTAAGDMYCLGKVMDTWKAVNADWVGLDLLALLRAMLESDPAKRPTASDALAHPWFA